MVWKVRGWVSVRSSSKSEGGSVTAFSFRKCWIRCRLSHVIAGVSEAINIAAAETWIASFDKAPRNDEDRSDSLSQQRSGCGSALAVRECARGFGLSPRIIRGAGMPDARCTEVPCAKSVWCEHEHKGSEKSDIPAQGRLWASGARFLATVARGKESK